MIDEFNEDVRRDCLRAIQNAMSIGEQNIVLSDVYTDPDKMSTVFRFTTLYTHTDDTDPTRYAFEVGVPVDLADDDCVTFSEEELVQFEQNLARWVRKLDIDILEACGKPLEATEPRSEPAFISGPCSEPGCDGDIELRDISDDLDRKFYDFWECTECGRSHIDTIENWDGWE